MPPVQQPSLQLSLKFLCFFCVLLAVSCKLVTPCPVNNFGIVLEPANPSESNGGNARAALQVVAGADRTVEISFSSLRRARWLCVWREASLPAEM